MKAQINKSQLMKKAWNLYRYYKYSRCPWSFSLCLRKAWKDTKREVALANYKRTATVVNKPVVSEFMYGCMEYYNGAGSDRRYFGD